MAAYRGRLLFPFLASVHRLDTSATEAASGYDPDFRSTKHAYPGGVGARTASRRELAPVDLPCQVEMGAWRSQRQTAAGDAPDSRLVLVLHMLDLEAAGLVDAATGDPLVRPNDRVSRLLRVADGTLVQAVRPPQGLYATEVALAGMGLGGHRNLLLVTLEDRPAGLVG